MNVEEAEFFLELIIVHIYYKECIKIKKMYPSSNGASVIRQVNMKSMYNNTRPVNFN